MQADQGAWATAHLSTPVTPHPPWGCSLSRATDPLQKLLRLVLQPPKHDPHTRLFPDSRMPVPEAHLQTLARGVVARLVGPEGGSWCDQSRRMGGWVWAVSRAAKQIT